MKEIVRGKLKIIGTGFYVTRYGMFLTAKHVLDELIDNEGALPPVGLVLHMAGEDRVLLRGIFSIARHTEFDVGLGQADNFHDSHPNDPLMNLRGTLSTSVPPVGRPLVTYAYPENEVLDFISSEGNHAIRGDYYEGKFLEYVTTSDNPSIPYPHYSTSIEIRGGASGGLVFDYTGKIVGVNCRGWDFRGAEFEGSNLSSILPPNGACHD
ncbi:MAG: S1 family peptidase [Pyrinomonadaceae bacterium]